MRTMRTLFLTSGLVLLWGILLSLNAQEAVWMLVKAEDQTPDLSLLKANQKWSGKTENQGMIVEFRQYSPVSKKTMTDRAQASWTWTAGPDRLIPGSRLGIQGKVTNLGESGSAAVSAALGTYGFTKGGLTTPGSPVAEFSGVVDIPLKQGMKPDGTSIPYFTLTFELSCGRSDSWIKRVMTYQWTPLSQQASSQTNTQPVTVKQPAGPQLIPAKTEFAAGEEIEVRFSGLPGYPQDWIGIYGAKAYHANEYIEWKYTQGAVEGTMRFASPRFGPGEYIFRVYENNGYKLLAQSVVFRVK